jgi:phosphatidylglycerophosphate synthase
MIARTVPPIAALRDRVAKKRKEQPWHRLMRAISIYITWLLLHTPISGNGVTFLFMLAGLAGSACFAVGSSWGWVAGALCFWLSVVLDFSDGEVARFREESSWFGDYFDETIHSVLLVTMYGGMALGIWHQQPGNPWPFVGAFLAAGATIITRMDAPLIMKALSQYYGLDRLHHMMPQLSTSEFAATRNMNRWLYYVDLAIFDLGFYFIALPIAALADRMDLFVYFYGLVRPLSALYMFARSWQLKRRFSQPKEELELPRYVSRDTQRIEQIVNG